MTDTDDYDKTFIPPKKIGDLLEVPEFWRVVYFPAEGGGFRLRADIVAEQNKFEAELAAMEAEHARKTAELNAERERLDAQLRDIAKRKAVEKALDAAGVTPRNQKFALAYLRDKYKFTVRDDVIAGEMVAAVETPLGEISVASAVGQWLTSEDGKDFLPPIDPRGDGLFSGMVRNLASTVH